MGETRALQDSAAASQFPGTRWSVVLQAQMGDTIQSGEALEEICRRYWYPIYAFLRKKGHTSADAQDLAQGFFRRLLTDETLQRVNQDRGKLRSFLLADLKRFLIDESRRENARKRGGGTEAVPIDEAAAESRYAEFFAATASNVDPERLFDQAWASDLLAKVMDILASSHAQSGKVELFEALRGSITGAESGPTYAEVAEQTGLTPGALRLQVMRLRRSFKQLLEREILETVETPEEVAEELRYLVSLLQNR